jgi:large subunit ribosomal protein L4
MLKDMSSNIVIKEFDLAASSIGEFSLGSFDVKNYPESIVHLALKNQLSSYRSANAKVKTMAEISGTTAKPFKQKGTGNARQGSKRSVQMRGGRCCFGPTGSENYNKKTLKKVCKKSISLIIASKIKEGKLCSFKNFSAINKASNISNFLKNNNLKKVLFILDKSSGESSTKFCSSVKNIINVDAIDFRSINPYLLLSFDSVVAESSVLEKIVKKYKDELS